MQAQKKQFSPYEVSARVRPIEFLTENGFAIMRGWELDGLPARLTTPTFHFLVRTPQGLEREVVLEVARQLIAEIHARTRGRVHLQSSFWGCCAERQLANWIWEHGDSPPDNQLRITECDAEEIMMAIRWGRDRDGEFEGD